MDITDETLHLNEDSMQRRVIAFDDEEIPSSRLKYQL